MSFLRSLLGPPDIDALEKAKDEAALFKALSYKKDEGIRTAAVKALFKLRKGEEAVRALRSVKRPLALAPLIAVLEEKWPPGFGGLSPTQHAEAMLRDFGPPGVQGLVGALQNETDAQLRRTAACVLERMGEGRLAVDTLKAMDPSLAVSPLVALLPTKRAAEALAEVGEPAVEELIRTSRYARGYMGPATDVQAAANSVLGRIGDPRAVETLVKHLEAEGSEVRRSAVRALGQIGDPALIDVLLPTLYDEFVESQVTTAEALDRLGWEPDGSEHAALYWFAKKRIDRCVEMGAVAARALFLAGTKKGLIGDQVKRERQDLWEALREIGPPAVEAVTPFLEGQKYLVRQEAVQALGVIGSPEAIDRIIAAMRALEGGFDGGQVMGTAVEVLSKSGDLRAVEPLLELLKDRPGARTKAALGLTQLTGESYSQDPKVWQDWWAQHPKNPARAT